MNFISRFYRIGFIIFLILFFLLGIAFFVVVNNPKVQSFITNKTTQTLNNKFGTDISIGSIEMDYLGRLILLNVKIKDDKKNTLADIEKVKASIAWLSFFKPPPSFHLDEIYLYNPKINVVTYKNEKKSNFDLFLKKFAKKDPNKKTLPLKLSIEVINGKLSIVNENLDKQKQIWLNATDWEAKIEDLYIDGANISAKVKKMSFDASRSFVHRKVENISLDFAIIETEMAFKNINLKTEETNLKGNLKFKYASISQFKNFKEDVIWDLNLSKSKIAYQDLKYFIPTWDKNEVVDLSVKISGPLSNFRLENPSLAFTDYKIAANSIVLRKIYDNINFGIEVKKMDAKINQEKLVKKLPTIAQKFLPSFLALFGDVDYKGDLSILAKKIRVDGNAKTSKGNLVLKADFKDYNQPNIHYSGEIGMQNLLIKDLLNIDQLNDLTGIASFDGVGLKWGEMNLRMSGNLSKLNFIDRPFSKVAFDGRLVKELFTGIIKIDDNKVNGTYNGNILLTENIGLDFTADINKIDLKSLGISDQKLIVAGFYQGSISFNTINDLVGDIRGENVKITHNKGITAIPALNMYSSIDINNEKIFNLNVDEKLDLAIKGDFVLTEVPDVIKNAFGSLATDYKEIPVQNGQKFTTDINFIDESFNQFFPNTFISKGTYVNGKFNTTEKENYITVHSSGFTLGKATIGDSYLVLDSKKADNRLLNKFEFIEIGNLRFNDISMNTYSLDTSTKVNTDFTFGSNKEVQFNLEFYQEKDEKGLYNLTFSPLSSLKIENEEWYLSENEGENGNVVKVDLENGGFYLNKMNFTKQEQKFSIDGDFKSEKDFKFVSILKDVFLEDLIPKEFTSGISLNGKANGIIDLINNGKEFKPKTNLVVTDFGLNGNTIGDLLLNANYNITKKVFDLEGRIQKGENKILSLKGEINNQNEIPTIDVLANFEKFDLSFLQQFLSGSLSNFRGLATGNALLLGSVSDPDFDAVVEIEDFGVGIPYIGVDYLAKGYNDVDISRRKGSVSTIKVNNISFKDTRFNSNGLVTGLIMFNKLSEWYLDLTIQSDNLLIMDTDYDVNENFYGKIFGKGDVSLLGEPRDLYIYGNAEIGNNTNITVNTSGTEQVSEENSLVTFINPKSIVGSNDEEVKPKIPTGITLDLALKIKPNAVSNLIFDQQTGDKLKARGEANDLRFVMLPSGEIKMNGDYVLNDGVYNFRQVIPKDFNLVKGGFVKWTGSPYKADISISAEYFRTVSNIGDYLNLAFSPSEKVRLLIDIKNNLEAPLIDFSVTTPDAREEVKLSLSERLNNRDEQLRQFGSILLSGKFFTNNLNTVQSTGTNIGTDLVLRQIGQVITNYVKDVDVNFEYVQANQISQTSNSLKTQLNLDINPRLKVNGTIGVPLQRAFNNDILTGQVEVGYDISKKGDQELMLKAFSKPTTFGVENFNTSTSFAQSYGAGIVIRKTFDSINEIFQSKKKLKYKPLYEDILKLDQINK